MKRFAIVFAMVWSMAGLLSGQQVGKMDVQKTLSRLHSNDWVERSAAYEKLRADRTALRSPEVRAALFELLAREDQEPSRSEEWGEYVGWLEDTVAAVADWNSSEQVRFLANLHMLPVQLADHAKVAVPFLIERYNRGDLAPSDKEEVLDILIRAYGAPRSGLDPEVREQVKIAILQALKGPGSDLRHSTALLLAERGGTATDMIPALEELAKTDPEPEGGYMVRRAAREAIEDIQKRAKDKDVR
jgi:hypothetical protein